MVHVNRQIPTFAAKMLGVDRGTVSDWLYAYARNGLDGLADDARLGRPPFVPRAELEKIVGDAKRFTAYEFVELVKERTGVKYSEPHGRRLLRSLGFAVKKTLRISDRVPSREELETWQRDVEKEVETLENDGFTLVMADESHQNSNIFSSGAVYVRGGAEPIPMPLGNQRQTVYGGVTLDVQTCHMAADKANDRSFIRYLNKLKKTVRQGCHDSGQRRLPQLWARTAIPRRERRFCQTVIPAAVLAVFESGRMAVAQRQGEDTAHL